MTPTAIADAPRARAAREDRMTPENHPVESLSAALLAEAAAVGALRETLVHQRAAVAASDTQAVNDSVDAIGRILLTLEQARRHRASLLDAWLGDPGYPLTRLEAALGGTLPAPLDAARIALHAAANATALEAKINRSVLEHVVDSGEAFLQAMFATVVDPAPVYEADRATRPPAAEAGVLLNRRA